MLPPEILDKYGTLNQHTPPNHRYTNNGGRGAPATFPKFDEGYEKREYQEREYEEREMEPSVYQRSASRTRVLRQDSRTDGQGHLNRRIDSSIQRGLLAAYVRKAVPATYAAIILWARGQISVAMGTWKLITRYRRKKHISPSLACRSLIFS